MGSSNLGSIGGILGGAAGAYFGDFSPLWMAGGAAAGQTAGDIAGGAGFKPERTVTAGAAGYGAGKLYGAGADYLGSQYPTYGGGGEMAGGGAVGSGSSFLGAGKSGGFSSMLPYLAVSGGLQYLGAEQNKSAFEDSQNRSIDLWRQNAFPNEANVDANLAQANSNLSSRYEIASRKLDEDMAARGVNASSPLYQATRANLLRAKQRDFASMATDLTKFRNTPTQAVPISTYTGTSGLSQAGDSFNSALGLYAGMDAYRNMRG